MGKLNNDINCICDNDYFYILKNSKVVEIYDNNFNCVEEISLDFDCSSISYNVIKKNFYLSKKKNNKQLYETKDFENFLPINIPIECLEDIKNITYCNCYKALLITTEKSVYIFYLKSNYIKVIYKVKDKHTYINSCTEPLGYNYCKQTTLIGTVCCCKDIYIAYRIGKRSYISKISKGRKDETVYETSDLIKAMFVFNGFICILVIKGCNQEIFCTEIECICDSKETIDCKYQIIESIAEIEKSISKILNSESLKIKSSIDKTNDIKELICVNSSVKEIIYYVTILEFILTEKLKVVNQSDDCEHDDSV